MSVNPDLVIAKATELKDAKELVARLEAELLALTMGGDGPTGRLADMVGLASAAPIGDKIITLLKSSPDRAFHFKEIFKTVGGKEASVRATLAKLINDTKIKRMEWGTYQAL